MTRAARVRLIVLTVCCASSLERGSRSEDVGRDRMPQRMHRDGPEPGPLTGRPDHLPDRASTSRQRPERRAHGQEHMQVAAHWATLAQIVDQRLANIGRERQPLVAVTLAAHDQLAGTPVDVRQLELGDLARTHPQA